MRRRAEYGADRRRAALARSVRLGVLGGPASAVFALLAACQTVAPGLPDAAATLPPASSALPEYRIQPGDILETHYVVDPTLNEQSVVAPDGRINIFYGPDLPAAGMTLTALRAEITARTKIIDRGFVVALRSSVGTRVYVTGEVATPGEITVNGPITALQAVSRAGGLKLGAQSAEAVLLRRNGSNQPQLYTLDLDAASNGRAPEEDITLQTYDIIYVPRDRVGNVSTIFERIRNAVPFNFSFIYGNSNGQF